MKALFDSKKVKMVLLGVVLYFAGPRWLGMTESEIQEIVQLLGVYVGGQSLVDALLAWKGSKTA